MGTALNTWHEVAPPAYAPLDRYGLFSVAQMRGDSLENGRTDGHWRFGVEWVSQACGYGWYQEQGPCEPPQELSTFNECLIRSGDPITVYNTAQDPIPGWTLEQQRQHAIERLQLGEERDVEYWLNDRMQLEASLPGGYMADYSAVHGWVGLGMVEDWAGWTFGSQFVIHMDRVTAISLSLHLHAEGGVLKTITGTPVVVGSGYGGYVFGFPTPKSYVYATGPIVVYRGEIVTTPAEVIDKSRNVASVIAQRDYALAYDCKVGMFTISLDTPG